MSYLRPLDLGRRLVDRRASLRLEQQDVADRAGVSRAYLSRLENGLVGNPKIHDLARIAAALDLPIEQLVRAEPDVQITHYAADFAELERQVAHLPRAKAERILRSFRASLEIALAPDDDDLAQ